jgi:hypothetical protein
MIGDPQHRVLQVNHISADVEVDDLSAAVPDQLGAHRKTGDQEATVGGLVAFTHNVRRRVERTHCVRQVQYCGFVVIIQRGKGTELAR